MAISYLKEIKSIMKEIIRTDEMEIEKYKLNAKLVKETYFDKIQFNIGQLICIAHKNKYGYVNFKPPVLNTNRVSLGYVRSMIKANYLLYDYDIDHSFVGDCIRISSFIFLAEYREEYSKLFLSFQYQLRDISVEELIDKYEKPLYNIGQLIKPLVDIVMFYLFYKNDGCDVKFDDNDF